MYQVPTKWKGDFVIDNLSNKKTDNGKKQVVDFSIFKDINSNEQTISSVDDLKKNEIDTLLSVGVNFEDNSEAGKFLMYGASVFTILPRIEGVEIIPLKEALRIYPEIESQYYFKAVNKDEDEFTKTVYERCPNGYHV